MLGLYVDFKYNTKRSLGRGTKARVVVNKTFLGHPQQSLVFPPNSTVPKIPHKHHSSSPKVHTNRISQKHVKSIRTHFDLLDLTKNLWGGVSVGNWGRFLWENEGLLRMSQKCFIDNYYAKISTRKSLEK